MTLEETKKHLLEALKLAIYFGEITPKELNDVVNEALVEREKDGKINEI